MVLGLGTPSAVWAAPAAEGQASSETEVAPAPAPTPPPPVAAPAVDPANYRMVLAGDIVVGVGGLGFVLMAAGLVLRSDASRRLDAAEASPMPDDERIAAQSQRVSLGTGLALGGGIAAAVCLTTGVTLIAVGRRRERLRRDGLLRGAQGRRFEHGFEPWVLASPVPAGARLAPAGLGLRWQLRL